MKSVHIHIDVNQSTVLRPIEDIQQAMFCSTHRSLFAFTANIQCIAQAIMRLAVCSVWMFLRLQPSIRVCSYHKHSSSKLYS